MIDGATPTLGALLDIASTSAVNRTHGPIPGKVISYDAGTKRATVQPVIGVATEAPGVYAPAPITQGVLVAWGEIEWPLLPGAWVMLIPQDADISVWGTSGATGQAPPTPRTCSHSDWIALPWCPSPIPVVLTDFVALASKVLTELQAIKTWADGHTHPPGTFANPGGAVVGVSAAPTAPMTAPGSVASTKVKCG
jgi:hypothetical protein